MTQDELLAKLKELAVVAKQGGQYDAHVDADDALLTYINDEEVKVAFHEIDKWYS